MRPIEEAVLQAVFNNLEEALFLIRMEESSFMIRAANLKHPLISGGDILGKSIPELFSTIDLPDCVNVLEQACSQAIGKKAVVTMSLPGFGPVILIPFQGDEMSQWVLARTGPEQVHAMYNNNELFLDMIRKAPVAMLILRGENLVVIEASKRMLDFAGKTREVIGKPLLEIMPDMKNEEIYQVLKRVYHTGEPFEGLEVPVQRRINGEMVLGYYSLILTPWIENGKVAGVLEVAIDETGQVRDRQHLEEVIAEKTRLEKRLRFNEQRRQTILDAMAEGLAIIEISGKIDYVNQMAAKILGMDPKEITERTYDDPRWNFRRIDGTELPVSEHPMARMIQSRSAIYDQEIALQRDGDKDLCYISVNGAPIFDEDDNLIGGVTTFMDVTQRRRLLQHMDEFISVASHELKTPVTSLRAAIQLLQRMKENPSPGKMFPMIEQAAKSLDKLSGLIDDLLNFTQIGQTEIPLRKSRFTLASMIGDCCSHIRHLGTHTIIVDGDLELEVYGDQQRLDQVMVNLVNNAVKYAPASDEISVEIKKLDGLAKVSVTDRGSGIPPEKLEHLFDRYYRGSNEQVVSGLGLGLYISSEIVKRHGGEMGVTSEVGRGSTFWFTIPLDSQTEDNQGLES